MSAQPAGWPAYLQRAMTARGYPKPSDLAKATGISDSVISRWLSGATVPGIDHLRKLSRVLGVPLPQLIVAAGHAEPGEMKMTTPPEPPPANNGLEGDLARIDALHIPEDKKALLKSMYLSWQPEEGPGRARKHA